MRKSKAQSIWRSEVRDNGLTVIIFIITGFYDSECSMCKKEICELRLLKSYVYTRQTPDQPIN